MDNLIFPLAGFGKRFTNAGYIQTKPLIHAGKKTIIEWALNSIEITDNINLIFVVRKDQCIRNGIDSYLKQLHPNCTIIELDKPTNGSLETVSLAINKLNLKGHLHIHTSDIATPIPIRIEGIFDDRRIDAATYTFKANNPSYSYCKLMDSEPDLVEYMIEKEVISQIANVGIYSFRSIENFMEYTNEILISGKKVKDEFYISSVFEQYVKKNRKVKAIDMAEVHIIGTPEELNFFTKFVIPTMNPITIGFVSDHSGFVFKDSLIKEFKLNGFSTVDYGCYSEKSCDYSDYVPIACKGLQDSEVDLVIGSCRSGQGINICANHQKNIISIIPMNIESLINARQHNCPNLLAFASDSWSPKGAYEAILKAYNKYHFEGGRHSTRIQKILEV